MFKNNSALSLHVYNKKLRNTSSRCKFEIRQATTSETNNTILSSSLNSDPHNLYTPSVQMLPDTKLKSLYASSRNHLYCYFDVNQSPCFIYIEIARATNV